MKPLVLKGTRQDIAAGLAQIEGQVREAIVFVDEPAASPRDAGVAADADLFAEMRPFMVNAQESDDSRESIYSRLDGE